MDEKLLRKLVRQVRILNFFMASFGVLILISMAIVGFMLWQLITFVQDVNQRLQSVNQRVQGTTEQLDVRKQACKDDRLGEFLQRNSEICK